MAGESVDALGRVDARRDDVLGELIARLEAGVGPDKCWLWPRKLDEKGRGQVSVGGRRKLAHRAVWEALRGPIPAGKLLCHHCDNPTCVNPAHLYVGTPKDNVRDMMERGRNWQKREPERVREIGRRLGKSNTWHRGAGNPKAKLTPEQIAAIRADRRPTRFLAAEYGVNRVTIQRIRNGSAWAK